MTKSNYKAIAKEYDMLRPNYPKELFDILAEEANINIDSILLEVGAGTGKATMGFANTGMIIDGIEIEASMAEILKEKTKDFNVNVSIDSFENWKKKRKEDYDLIYSAQAFHWIDKEIKYKRCHELIKDSGKLGLFWYASVFESDSLFNEISDIFKKYNTGFSSTKKDLLHNLFSRERDELETTQYFDNIKEFRFKGKSIEQDVDTFINRYNTTSAYETLNEENKIKVNKELEKVIKRFGGIVTTTIYYTLFTADKSLIK